MVTVDANPDLSPFERHVMFTESLQGEMTRSKYMELLKLHFQVKTKKQWTLPKQPKKETLWNRIKQFRKINNN